MIEIRKATTSDIEVLYKMIIEIAQYHQAEAYVKTTKELLLKDGFSEEPNFQALIANYQNEPAGYISYTFHYSIWLGQKYLNIDDVFVRSDFRGKQIGEALMQEIKRVCNQQGITKVKWEVEEDNKAAIRFYERLGAKMKVKGVFHWDLTGGL